MKAKINKGGTSVTTENPLGPKPIYHPKYYDELNAWKKAESERQTLEIENVSSCGKFILVQNEHEKYVEPGQIVDIEILPNGKARIL